MHGATHTFCHAGFMILNPVTLRLRGSVAANGCASGQMCTRQEEERESFKCWVEDLGMHVHKKVFFACDPYYRTGFNWFRSCVSV